MKKQLLILLAALMLSLGAGAQMVLQFNTNLSDGTTVALPLKGAVNVSVNWGDGTSNNYTTAENHDHTYAAEGTYTVEISGSLEQFGNGSTANPNLDKLIGVTSFGNIGLTSLYGAFKEAINLVQAPVSLPSSVTSISAMFSGCTSFNYNIGSWNVSNVTNMRCLFQMTPSFNQDISNWDVSNVTNMCSMFAGCLLFNQDISSWEVSNVEDMSYMFVNCGLFNQNIGSWDVSNVANMSFMFVNCLSFNQDIGSWNVTSVTNMTDMFKEVTLSTANYNNLLIGWAGQTVNNGVNFHGGNSKYSPGAAATARGVLTSTYNWTITDGGSSNALAVSTFAPSAITATTATSGGEVIADGGSPVTARGVVWSTSNNPTIFNNTGLTSDGTGLGAFNSSITGLTGNTTYYIRAYATNANGTAYGTNLQFTTLQPTSVATFEATNNIAVYPNPFQNRLNISNANNASHLVITNILGKVVITADLSQASNQTIETDLPSGIYLFTIISNDGSRVVRKMIRE
ncbi:MAG: BspA family leucine-rich repeat surface protein [Lentimicrobium sp.]|jgi:surface protein|nr:BspA family leucine-rich repeat surface protein [Lentimicrobium sp.]